MFCFPFQKKKQRKSVSEDEEAEEELPTSPRGMGKPGLSAFAMLDVEDVTDQVILLLSQHEFPGFDGP